MSVTTIERCFARAAVYRLLSLLFTYPSNEVVAELPRALEAALVASNLMDSEVAKAAAATAEALRERDQPSLAVENTSLFTHSASPDCPLNECAYSSKQIYREVQELADIAGFYHAFGLEMAGQRPDELSAELEFCYLLALKEGHARETGRRTEAAVCRDVHKTFVHDHLGRWAENIGQRVQALAPESAYAAFGRLLCEFAASEIAYLKTGTIAPHEELPNPPEPLDEEGCPAAAGTLDLDNEDLIGELKPVETALSRKGG